MATIKVKFRSSTVSDREGTIYYRIIHERKVRQLLYLASLDASVVDKANSLILKAI